MIEKVLYYYIPLFADISKLFVLTAFLTAVLEVMFFFFFYSKNKKFLAVVFIANIISNVILNFCLSLTSHLPVTVLTGEISVVISEFAVFYFCLKTKGKETLKLFILTVLSNLLSFLTGLFLF